MWDMVLKFQRSRFLSDYNNYLKLILEIQKEQKKHVLFPIDDSKHREQPWLKLVCVIIN